MRKTMRKTTMFVAVALLAAVSFIAFSPVAVAFAADPADDAEPLRITLEQYVVIPPSDEGEDEEFIVLGGERMTPQGTIIEYRLYVANVSDEPIGDLVLGLPVPVGTAFVEASDRFDRENALLQASVDGGETFRTPPVKYVVKQDDGTEIETIATADIYTDLRLVFLTAISSGEEVEATYRVEVR